jgi:predicted GNAT superfamily acetyltransferase
VDLGYAGQGLGALLLADAVKKAQIAAESIGVTVVVVDPIDEAARSFYAAFGFVGLRGPQRRMFLVLPRSADRN